MMSKQTKKYKVKICWINGFTSAFECLDGYSLKESVKVIVEDGVILFPASLIDDFTVEEI